MPAESAAPWERSCRELAELLGRALAAHGSATAVEVGTLGTHDAFASGPPSAPGPGPGADRPAAAPGPGDGPPSGPASGGVPLPASGAAPGAVPGAIAGPGGHAPASGAASAPASGGTSAHGPASRPGHHPAAGPASAPGAAPEQGGPPGAPAEDRSVHGPFGNPSGGSPSASAGNPSGGPAAGAPVPVRLYGRHAVVGPFPAADGRAERPCPRCLSRRWQAVRSIALREALELGSGTRAAGELPHVTPFGAGALAGLIAARLEGAGPHAGAGAGTHRGHDIVHLVDLESLRIRHYPLIADPECDRCGRAEKDTPQAATLTLRSAPKHRSGSFRLRDISAYDLPVTPYANPVCGSLGPSVVHDVSSTSTSATIGCFSMRSGEYLRETFWGGHADTFSQSVRIGVLEGLERYAGMRSRAKTAQVRDSLEGLRARREHALDPRECGLYSEEFHLANPWVPPFTADREIPWVWGYSLRDRRPVLVPEVLTYYHAPGLENRFVQESSNGCASGGCLEEAVYFGLMEVVERDAFLLTWYGQAALPEIDPRTSSRPATRQMVDRLEMYGYEARFFDTRISFPIPVVTAVAERHDRGRGRMCFGAGAGLDPEAALSAALCEIATDAVNLPGRTERDEERLRAMTTDFAKVEALHDHPLAYGIPEMGEHAAFLLGEPDAPRPPRVPMAGLYGDGSVPPVSDDLRDDLLRCVETVTARGFDVIAVDQTMPEQRGLGLTTVSVLVPGLLPIDFGWTRQRALRMPRLRTALREAGLHHRDLTPADINPAPHPFP